MKSGLRIMNEVYANAIATPLSLGEGPSNFVAASLSDFYSTPNREYGDNLYSHEVEDNLKDTAINCKVTSEFVMVGHEDITENDCVQSEEVLRSLGSESEGEVSKHVATFQEKDLHKEGFKFQGMIFNSSAEFKWAVKCHQAMRRKDIKFVKNEENKTRKMKKVGEVKRCRVCGQRGHNKTTCKFQNGQAQAAEIEVDENEAEFEKEDAFENVSIETQVPKFVLDEMDLLSSQSTNPMTSGGHTPNQMSTFISVEASHITQPNQHPGIINKGGRTFVTLSNLQQTKCQTRRNILSEKQPQNKK
nr:Zinc knuckle family protein [Ipomoea batatas]